jgi:hypothetical protein
VLLDRLFVESIDLRGLGRAADMWTPLSPLGAVRA